MIFKTLKCYLIIGLWVVGLIAPFCAPATSFAYFPLDSKELEMEFTGDAGGRFDSNITQTKSSKKADWVTSLAAGIRTIFTGKKQTVGLHVQDCQDIYSRYSEFTNNSQNVNLDYKYERTKYDRIGLKNLFRHYYTPQDYGDAFGRTSGQYGYITNETDLSYTRDVTRKLSLTATGGGGISLLDKKAGKDSYVIRGGASGVYSLSSKWSLLGAYDFLERKFKGGSDAMIHTMTGGTRFYFTDRLFWDGIAGLQVGKNYLNEVKVAPTLRTSLSGEIDKKTTARLLFNMGSETTSYEASVFNQWRASADVTRVLHDRLSAYFGTFFGMGDYRTISQKQNLFGINGGLTYQVSEHFKAVAGYSFQTRDSNVNSIDYHQSIATAKIVAAF